MLTPEIMNRCVEFSDELDRAGVEPEAQFAAFGALMLIALSEMPRDKAAMAAVAHVVALQDGIGDAGVIAAGMLLRMLRQ